MNEYSVCRWIMGAVLALLLLGIAVPFMHPPGTFTGLDGAAGIVDHADLWRSHGPLTAAVYGLGDLLCHQGMSRSFVVNGSQMPFCIRDVSVMAGIVVGMAAWELLQLHADPRGKAALATASLLIATMMVQWAVEQSTGADMPLLRTATGLMAGLGIGTLIWAYFENGFDKRVRAGSDRSDRDRRRGSR